MIRNVKTSPVINGDAKFKWIFIRRTSQQKKLEKRYAFVATFSNSVDENRYPFFASLRRSRLRRDGSNWMHDETSI